MVKLAIDAMGGDLGSKVIVEAIKRFNAEYPDAKLFVVGKKEELVELDSIATIVDARDIMEMADGAMAVLRKKDSSMIKAIDLVEKGEADGVLSCGSTGAFLTAATVKLKLMNGVERAGLLSLFPTVVKDKKVVVMDIGASSECSAAHLVTFAKMGHVFARQVMKIDHPKVYLLSNGAEKGKGSPVSKEAFKILEETAFHDFAGNLEARDVMSGEADVVVAGGYEGNILLKGVEGLMAVIKAKMKEAFSASLKTKIGYLLIKKSLKKSLASLDHKTTGGALLFGVNGIVIKAHGNSDALAFYHALKLAHSLVENKTIEKVEKELC